MGGRNGLDISAGDQNKFDFGVGIGIGLVLRGDRK